MTRHHEKAVSGKTEGLIELDQEVTWQARHSSFGLRVEAYHGQGGTWSRL